MELKVNKAVVVLAAGTDTVFLHTDFPSPFSPDVDDTPLAFSFSAPRNKGADYVRETFGIEPEIIDAYVPMEVLRSPLHYRKR